MPTVTLDQIRESIEKKYAPVVVPFGDGLSCTLVQALRLPKDKRRAMSEVQKESAAGEIADGDDMDSRESRQLEALRQIVRIAATDPTEADLLLDEIGDDVLVLSEVLNAYSGATQLPEASASAS